MTRLTNHLARVPAPLLALRFARLEFGGILRRVARVLGIRRPKAMSIDELVVPDNAVCNATVDLVKRVSPEFLFNHCIRSYLFGVAIGHNLDLRWDAELLYLAAMLHDIGLVPEYDGPESFEVQGAQAARAFTLSQGLAAERADRIHEAVALHAAVGIADTREPELALLHYGAGLDVIGVHREDVHPDTIRSIVQTHPRADFKEGFVALLEDQIARKPNCHIAGHMGFGFAKRVRTAPFDS